MKEEGKTKNKYDCSFDFDIKTKRKKYKFIVITRGDLDVNNAMLLKEELSVKNYLKEAWEDILAIIEIKKWVR